MEIKFKVLLGEEVVGIKMRICETTKATNCAPSNPFGLCPPYTVIGGMCNEAILPQAKGSLFFLCTMGVTIIIVNIIM